MSKHTRACDEHNAKAAEELLAWEQRHPNHCRTCCGYGYISVGGGYDEPWIEDTCADCVDDGKCPMCAAGIDPDGDTPCDCGWNPEPKKMTDPYPGDMCFCTCDYDDPFAKEDDEKPTQPQEH